MLIFAACVLIIHSRLVVPIFEIRYFCRWSHHFWSDLVAPEPGLALTVGLLGILSGLHSFIEFVFFLLLDQMHITQLRIWI